jgi:hypothetical protein
MDGQADSQTETDTAGSGVSTTLMRDVFSNSDLTDRVFSLSNPAAIFLFGRTSRTARALVKSYMQRAWNVDRHLSRFFSNPRAFRTLQARTGTLVSGSNALQFFDRSYYPESDLNLYIHCGRERDVGSFLLADGYQFQPSNKQRSDFMVHDARVYMSDHRPFEYPNSASLVFDDNTTTNYPTAHLWGVMIIYSFIKPAPRDGEEELKVQLLVTRDAPIEAVLLFHSSTSRSCDLIRSGTDFFVDSLCHERYRIQSSVFTLSKSHLRETNLPSYAQRRKGHALSRSQEVHDTWMAVG